MNVTVSGAPGYEDHFPASLIALLPRVDDSEMMAVVRSANGDWHVFPARHVHIDADEPYDVPYLAPRPLKAGDRIRILRDGLSSAAVRAGDVLTVLELEGPHTFATNAPTLSHPGDRWVFNPDDRGTGWEIV